MAAMNQLVNDPKTTATYRIRVKYNLRNFVSFISSLCVSNVLGEDGYKYLG